MASQLKFNDITYETHPLYGTKTIKKDVSFNYETTLDSVEFSNGDADLIINADYETEFILWDGTTRYKFYKNDCVIRRGDRVVTAKVTVIGDYADVKGKLNTEVNIADNKYIKRELNIPYAPIVQFYWGNGIISSITNEVVFQSDSSSALEGNGWYELLEGSLFGNKCFIVQQLDDPVPLHPVGGIYIPIESFGGTNPKARLQNEGGLPSSYTLVWEEETGKYYIQFVTVTTLYKSDLSFDNNPLFSQSTAYGDAVVMSNVDDSTDKLLIYSYVNPKFRIITTKEQVPGWSTIELNGDDTLPNSAYTHALIHSNDQQRDLLKQNLGFDISSIPNDIWFFSDDFDDDRGEFGLCSDQSPLYAGKYFDRPIGVNGLLPIMDNYWKYGGLFFNLKDEVKDILLLAQGEQTALFYDFEDVLSDMTGLTVNSSFLNGLTPLKDNRKLYLTPLSNIKVKNYDEPATKQILTIADMLLFLERVYNCYWDIYGGELRVEHYSFFDNGGSYMGDKVTTDLVSETNSWNGRSIYGDEFTFVKEESKKNKIWKFQNKHNELYEATVITDSPYIEDGNDDKAVGKMNIDLITILLQDVSNDGVLVIEVDQNDNIIFDDRLINGGLAMTKAIGKYHLYGEGGSTTNYGAAKSRARLKEETITHSVPISDVQGLIRTREGNGKIDSVTIDNDGVVVIKLRHDEY